MTNFAATDLHLAIAHHVLIFSLAGVLAFEIGAVRPNLTMLDIPRVARVDLWYGILAALILIVGFSRAIFAAKGWAYYSHNAFFWAKIGTFALVGLLSIAPMMTFLRWRRELKSDPAFVPSQRDVNRVRWYLFTEAVLFLLIPAFAAAMARGYGSF